MLLMTAQDTHWQSGTRCCKQLEWSIFTSQVPARRQHPPAVDRSLLGLLRPGGVAAAERALVSSAILHRTLTR